MVDKPDNVLAEPVKGLLKTELVRRGGLWRRFEQGDLVTLEQVWWWNNFRLHCELDYRTPIEIEQTYYADQESPLLAAAGQ